MVTTADRGGAVGGSQESLDFGPVEEGNQGTVKALVRDGENTPDERGVFGLTEGSEVEERVDGSKARVACADRVATTVLELGQEVTDDRGVEVGEVETGGPFTGAFVNEGEQQAEGVTVGSDGVRAGLAPPRRADGEEGLEGGGKRAQGNSPRVRSRR